MSESSLLLTNCYWNSDKCKDGVAKGSLKDGSTITGLSSKDINLVSSFNGFDDSILDLSSAPPKFKWQKKTEPIRLQVGSEADKTSAIYINLSANINSFNISLSSAESSAASIDIVDSMLDLINQKSI